MSSKEQNNFFILLVIIILVIFIFLMNISKYQYIAYNNKLIIFIIFFIIVFLIYYLNIFKHQYITYNCTLNVSIILIVIVFFVYCMYIFKRHYTTTLIYVESSKDAVAVKPDYRSVNNPIINTPDFYTLNGAVDPVRGTGDSKYRQIGTLSSYINQTHTFPLIAKKNENDGTRWYYYTKVANASVPIMVNNKICDDITGCDALFSNDTVFIPELDEDFRVALFNTGYY